MKNQAEKYQPLFDLMAEYNLHLTESEMDEIIMISLYVEDSFKPTFKDRIKGFFKKISISFRK